MKRKIKNPDYFDGLEIGLEDGYNTGYDNGFKSGYREGVRKGKDDGFHEGVSEGKLIVAEKMLESNIDMAMIESCTDLDEDKILKLKNKN